MKKTNVLFLIETPVNDFPCDVFAYFPDIQWNPLDPDLYTCYAHIGQHSSCHQDYAKQCKEAKYHEYLPLLMELIGRGYKLNVLNTFEIAYHRKPTASEIKQGYGATHYREFNASVFINNKTGDIKEWVLADDGLRYYRN